MPISSSKMTHSGKIVPKESRHVAVVHAGLDRSLDEDRLALHTMAALRDAGHQVTVVLPETSPFEDLAEREGFPRAYLPREPANRSLPWDSIARIGGACGVLWSRRIRLVHCINPLPLATLLPAARMLKIPVVSQIHSMRADEELDHTLCRFADILLPSSPRVEQSLIAYLADKKTHSIRHLQLAVPGLDFPDPSCANRGIALREREAVSRDALVIALAGELNPGRGCDLLFEAIQLIGRRGLHPPVWIGMRGGDRPTRGEKSRNALARLARNLGIDEQVRFLSLEENAHDFFAAADILAIPSRFDPLGMTAREGMLGGCAVVAAQTGGLTDAIAHNETGLLVPPVDPAALAQALFRLLVDLDLRSRLSLNGKLHGDANFSREPFAQQLLHSHEIAAGFAPATQPAIQPHARPGKLPAKTAGEISRAADRIKI